jgi:hypothetical protein
VSLAQLHGLCCEIEFTVICFARLVTIVRPSSFVIAKEASLLVCACRVQRHVCLPKFRSVFGRLGPRERLDLLAGLRTARFPSSVRFQVKEMRRRPNEERRPGHAPRVIELTQSCVERRLSRRFGPRSSRKIPGTTWKLCFPLACALAPEERHSYSHRPQTAKSPSGAAYSFRCRSDGALGYVIP